MLTKTVNGNTLEANNAAAQPVIFDSIRDMIQVMSSPVEKMKRYGNGSSAADIVTDSRFINAGGWMSLTRPISVM
jgi:hypothetical protein